MSITNQTNNYFCFLEKYYIANQLCKLFMVKIKQKKKVTEIDKLIIELRKIRKSL